MFFVRVAYRHLCCLFTALLLCESLGLLASEHCVRGAAYQFHFGLFTNIVFYLFLLGFALGFYFFCDLVSFANSELFCCYFGFVFILCGGFCLFGFDLFCSFIILIYFFSLPCIVLL